jgi:hypothetical protein
MSDAKERAPRVPLAVFAALAMAALVTVIGGILLAALRPGGIVRAIECKAAAPPVRTGLAISAGQD